MKNKTEKGGACLVAHALPQWFPPLRGHALGHRYGRHTARLRAHNPHARTHACQTKNNLSAYT